VRARPHGNPDAPEHETSDAQAGRGAGRSRYVWIGIIVVALTLILGLFAVPNHDGARTAIGGTRGASLDTADIAGGDGPGRTGRRDVKLAEAEVTIDSAAGLREVPHSFLGLSTEYWTLPLFERHMALLERVVSLLHVSGNGPFVLRVGGDSADHSFWEPRARKVPHWVFALTPEWLRQTGTLVRRSHLRLILDLNLVTGSPSTAARWARAAVTGLPRGSVMGFEIGNEPDIYSHRFWLATVSAAAPGGHWLPSALSASSYTDDFRSFAEALEQVAPQVPLVGPAVANPAVNADWISSLIAGAGPEAASQAAPPGADTADDHPQPEGTDQPADPDYANRPADLDTTKQPGERDPTEQPTERDTTNQLADPDTGEQPAQPDTTDEPSGVDSAPPTPRLAVVSAHRYPLSACAKRGAPGYPTVARVLSERASAGMAHSVKAVVLLAHRAGLPFRLTELNSVTCGGRPGVSNAFATALWAPDALFELLQTGVDGVNVHVRSGAINAAFTLTTDGLLARPLLYGLILFARTLGPGAQLVDSHLHAESSLHLKVWAVRLRDGVLHVLLIDKSSHSVVVDLQLPAHGPATVERLLAPSVRSSTDVTLDGQSLGRDGDWVGQRVNQTILHGQHGYELTIPGASAALLRVRLRPGALEPSSTTADT
jgi:Glycosyl hydrolase family 79 C-terminal beta domain